MFSRYNCWIPFFKGGGFMIPTLNSLRAHLHQVPLLPKSVLHATVGVHLFRGPWGRRLYWWAWWWWSPWWRSTRKTCARPCRLSSPLSSCPLRTPSRMGSSAECAPSSLCISGTGLFLGNARVRYGSKPVPVGSNSSPEPVKVPNPEVVAVDCKL
jgi:hypothetical protein